MSPKYTNKQTTNKGVAWLYSEVCALLDVWADHDIQQQLAGRLHNMCVYDKISKRLLSLGIDRTGEQCREKIKKLKRDYKIVVENNYAPAFARKLLGCYDKVHEVFGKCAVVKPSSVIESLLLADDQPKSNLSSPQIKKEIPESNENSTETSNDLATSFSINSSHYDSDTESGDDCEENENDDNDKMQNILHLHKQAKKRKHSQSHVFDTLAKSHESLREKYLELERKRLKRQMDMERNRLLLAEKRRQQERQQEYRMFKSLLSVLANKHRDSVLRLNGEDVVTYHFTHAGRD